jgi:hypothetical protein
MKYHFWLGLREKSFSLRKYLLEGNRARLDEWRQDGILLGLGLSPRLFDMRELDHLIVGVAPEKLVLPFVYHIF